MKSWSRDEPLIAQRSGFEYRKQNQVSLGLDWCHAVHHVSLALESLVCDAERPRVFKKLRKWLKRGEWKKVIHELIDFMLEAGLDESAPVANRANNLKFGFEHFFAELGHQSVIVRYENTCTVSREGHEKNLASF